MSEVLPRTVLQIDLHSLRENFAEIKRRIAPCRALAVVKTDAYGLGLLPVADALKDLADMFAVAEVADGVALQKFGVPTMILGALFPDEIECALRARLIVPVGSAAAADAVSAVAGKLGMTAEVAVIVDGGMGRVGFPLATAENAIAGISRCGHLNFRAIYTHCPTASVPGDADTHEEIAAFRTLVGNLRRRGMDFPDVHIAASDAVANFPASIQAPFNMARIGLAMYGMQPFPGMDLPCVCRMSSRLLEVRKLRAGSTLGYGRTFTLKKDSLVGTVGCGYACGLPLALGNTGHMLVRGVSVPIAGRISMDYATCLLDAVPDAAVGDEVVLFGRQGNAQIFPMEWASAKGTHLHDILCSVSGRIPRIYQNEK